MDTSSKARQLPHLVDEIRPIESSVNAPWARLLLPANDPAEQDTGPISSIQEERREAKVRDPLAPRFDQNGTLAAPFGHREWDALDASAEIIRAVQACAPERVHRWIEIVEVDLADMLIQQQVEGGAAAAAVGLGVDRILEAVEAY